MRMRGWAIGGVASVVLHGAGLAAITLTIKPEPVPDQPVPTSSFSIEAADVRRSRATPQTPAGEPTTEAKAPATKARSGAIEQSRANTSDLEGTAVPALNADAVAMDARPARTEALANVKPAAQEALVAKADTALRLGATEEAPVAAIATVPSSGAIAPVTAPALQQPVQVPTAQPTALAETTGQRPPPAAASGQYAALSAPQAQRTSDLPLPAIAGRAALAWSGNDGAPISAASLAAIAAFTQEGDIGAASAQVRDGIEGILASVPCARLQTTFIPATGELELRGHIPEGALRGPVLAALREQVGDAIPVSDQLLILPRPQCGALAEIANVGLPQSTEQLTNPAVIGDDGFAQNYTYLNGQRLTLDLTAPDYGSYIYVDYFAADGTVLHLQPNDIVPLVFSPAKSPLGVGRAQGDGSPVLELTVSPPFGQEIAAAFAASVPLYDGVRPIQEPAAPYLAFLKTKVAEARLRDPAFKGEWVYFFISTKAE